MSKYFYLRFPRGLEEHFPVASKLKIDVVPVNQVRRVERMIKIRGHGFSFVAMNANGRVYASQGPSDGRYPVFGRGTYPRIEFTLLEALEKLGAIPSEEIELLRRFEVERNTLLREQRDLERAFEILRSRDVAPSLEQKARVATLKQTIDAFVAVEVHGE